MISRQHFFIRSGLLAGIYLLVLLGFHTLDLINNFFAAPHSAYVLYHILKTLISGFIVLIALTAGQTILSKISRSFHPLDHFIFSNITGVAVITVVMHILGYVHGYYTVVAVALTTPLVFAAPFYTPPFTHFLRQSVIAGREFARSRTGNNIIPVLFTSVLTGLICIQVLGIYCANVMFPYTGANDSLGLYIPYYEEAIRVLHGLSLSKYLNAYFYSKGFGLQFLGALLTDPHSLQLTNFYVYLLSLLVLGRLVLLATGKMFWSLLSVFLYLQVFSGTDFIVEHLQFGMFVIFAAYCCVSLLTTLSDMALSRVQYAMFCVFACLVIFRPIFTVIPAALVCFTILVSFLLHDRFRFRYALKLLPVMFLTLVLVYGVNYYQTGYIDLHLRMFDQLMDVEKFQQAMDPYVVLVTKKFRTNLNEIGVKYILQAFFSPQKWQSLIQSVLGRPLSWVLLAAMIGVILKWSYLFGRRKRRLSVLHLKQSGSVIGYMSLYLIGFTFLLTSLYAYELFHAVVYIYFFIILLFIVILSHLSQWTRPEIPRNVSAIVALLVLALAFPRFIQQQQGNYRKEVFRFLVGTSSFAQAYRWNLADYLYVQNHFTHDNKVISLNFATGAYGLPGGKWQRPLLNDYNTYPHFRTILYGAPREAHASLQEVNVRYAYLNTTNTGVLEGRLLFTTQLPIFQPDTILTYWDVVANFGPEQRQYVLVLRDQPLEGEEKSSPEQQALRARFLVDYRDSFTDFYLSKESMGQLRETGLPEEIVNRLKELKYQSFQRSYTFLEAVMQQIGKKETHRYQEQILNAARDPNPIRIHGLEGYIGAKSCYDNNIPVTKCF